MPTGLGTGAGFTGGALDGAGDPAPGGTAPIGRVGAAGATRGRSSRTVVVAAGRTVSVAAFTNGDGAGRAGEVLGLPDPPGLPVGEGFGGAAAGTATIGTVAPADDEPESPDDGRPAPLEEPGEPPGVGLVASLAASPGVPGRGETLGAVP